MPDKQHWILNSFVYLQYRYSAGKCKLLHATIWMWLNVQHRPRLEYSSKVRDACCEWMGSSLVQQFTLVASASRILIVHEQDLQLTHYEDFFGGGTEELPDHQKGDYPLCHRKPRWHREWQIMLPSASCNESGHLYFKLKFSISLVHKEGKLICIV